MMKHFIERRTQPCSQQTLTLVRPVSYEESAITQGIVVYPRKDSERKPIKEKYYDCHDMGDGQGLCVWGTCPSGWKSVTWDYGCIEIEEIKQHCCVHT
ncbi:hypothetical protein Ocin01_20124 [Orchesella cincta]|uniref:Uncharacterized protein n=1 Tax=Orchesella cincta TaxID=48709 RepID=A0A1D2M0S0_ORCCI|nr:hypothetical protein Ocin01_20124 [Orchesella cincta]